MVKIGIFWKTRERKEKQVIFKAANFGQKFLNFVILAMNKI